MGASADVLMSPGAAILMGGLSGSLSTFGFAIISPIVQRKLHVKRTLFVFCLFFLVVLPRVGVLLPLSVVASFSYAEAIWNLLLRLLLLGVMPGKSELLGTLLITVVIMFLFIYEARQPHS